MGAAGARPVGAAAWPASAVRPDGIASGSFTRTGSCTRTGSFVVGQCLGAQLVVGGRPGAPESFLPGQSRKSAGGEYDHKLCSDEAPRRTTSI